MQCLGAVPFCYGGLVLLAVACRLVAALTRAVLLICVSVLAARDTGAANLQPFTAFAVNEGEIRAAISRAKEAGPRPDEPVSGITVPHHLLAADLMALGFWSASGGTGYDRIIVLLPDHFSRAKKPFATSERAYETVLGPVVSDTAAARALLAHKKLFEASDLFEREHGLQALLPFVAHFFPRVPIVPVAISYRSDRSDWDAAIAKLRPLVTSNTLIVQSTDFSHYLPVEVAIQRDQEVLNVLATADLEALAKMRQPDHMDSTGAQYIQMRLQDLVFQARPYVIANKNSQDYIRAKSDKTTSYVVQVYCNRQQVSRTPCKKSALGRTYYFGGDTLLGRHFLRLLNDDSVKSSVTEAVLAITGGAPMILNLEGVVLDEVPHSRHATAMVMPSKSTIDWLARLNVIAAGLANNHSMDFGAEAYRDMVKVLEGAGIKTLSSGDVKDVGAFRIWALSDFGDAQMPFADRLQPKDLEPARVQGVASPLLAFIHWGTEGSSKPRARELMLADILRQRGVTAIVGAHSHKASTSLLDLAGGASQMVFSLGNFLFDQPSSVASGALLEVTVFDQGTVFTRLRPIPNLYDLARAEAGARPLANSKSSAGPTP